MREAVRIAIEVLVVVIVALIALRVVGGLVRGTSTRC